MDVRVAMCNRLHQILDKHVKPEDSALTDRELVEAVMERFRRHMDAPIIDVNE